MGVLSVCPVLQTLTRSGRMVTASLCEVPNATRMPCPGVGDWNTQLADVGIARKQKSTAKSRAFR
jgi:hypothetical protein